LTPSSVTERSEDLEELTWGPDPGTSTPVPAVPGTYSGSLPGFINRVLRSCTYKQYGIALRSGVKQVDSCSCWSERSHTLPINAHDSFPLIPLPFAPSPLGAPHLLFLKGPLLLYVRRMRIILYASLSYCTVVL
jgi:hypothetical protein